MDRISTSNELSEFVRSHERVRVTGGGTKPGANESPNLSLADLAGIVRYDAAEFTLTCLAGTPVKEISQLLRSQQQYLPFDPPLLEAGATAGGTIATAMASAGRFRFGGVRDFLLGTQLVIGDGAIVVVGSKVVKNAAGFDLPKLMVGSLGTLGIITEATFKVFPEPMCWKTIEFELPSLELAMKEIQSLASSFFDVACLVMIPPNRVLVRVGGLRESVTARCQRILHSSRAVGRIIAEDNEARLWNDYREFRWVPPRHSLVKVSVTPDKAILLANCLSSVPLRICLGGHLAWIAWPSDCSRQEFEETLQRLGCRGLAITGEWSGPWIGKSPHNEFGNRLASALDPHRKFVLSRDRQPIYA